MGSATEQQAAGLQEAALSVAGMTCASCVASVEKALGKVPGVSSAAVNLARGRAVVKFDPARTHVTDLAKAVNAAGYSANPETSGVVAGRVEAERLARQKSEARSWMVRAIVGAVLWLPIEVWHWVGMMNGGHGAGLHDPMTWAGAGAATVGIIFVGWGFYRGAIGALLRGTTSMDTLIAMGASVAYGYSAVALLGAHWGKWNLPAAIYFNEAVGLLTLISVGHWLEARARMSAGSAIRELLTLAPAKAMKLDAKDEAIETPVAELREGDRVLVAAGERVPTDGKVVSGKSAVDESMITGEATPAKRGIGDEVIGGTLNQDGRLILRVTKVGSETALAQIVQMVEAAQSAKAPVQKLADRISAVFVPAVLGVAVVTGLGWWLHGLAKHVETAVMWGDIARAVCSVLIIACPCALGLAVPAALMVGIGRGAKRGILIRDIDALQHAERVGTVVLDKTGTVTAGKPAVEKVVGIGGVSEEELLRLAGSAEQGSAHPLARAIVAAARVKKVGLVEPQSFRNETGYGVIAKVEGRKIVVGGETLLQRVGKVTSGYPAQQAAARTIVHVAEATANGEVNRLGLILLSDPVKADSAGAVAMLKGMGLRTMLLTGDNRVTATAIAKQVGIDEVQAEVKPDGKAKAIAALQEGAGKKMVVAMIGDGINDAPALAQADLGIAMGAGSDVAKETGGIVLVSGSLTGAATAIRLSRATMKKVRQNLFFAFAYNVVAIPLAAFGILNPLIAAGAMALSDVTVLGNALLLRRSKID